MDILDRQVYDIVKSYKEGVEGVRLTLQDSDGKELFQGIVNPNEQYEYEAKKSGEYTICIELTEKAFSISTIQNVKTSVKFASEFHRDRKEKLESSGQGAVSKATENKDDEIKLTEGHFAPLRRRISKMTKTLNDIISF